MKKPIIKFPQEQINEFEKLTQNVADAQKALAAFEKKVPRIYQGYFFSKAKLLFEENNNLVSFGWKQYTPSWNDGDTCYFSTTKTYPIINGIDEDEDEDENETASLTQAEKIFLRKKIVDFLKDFSNTQLEHWFGEGIQITVTKQGISLCDYDCGY